MALAGNMFSLDIDDSALNRLAFLREFTVKAAKKLI
jgi:hypothetical protein